MKLTISVYFKLQALENYYIKFCSQGLMPAYLITNNTGQGIVIKERQCSHQFSRYYQCTLLLYKHHLYFLLQTLRSVITNTSTAKI